MINLKSFLSIFIIQTFLLLSLSVSAQAELIRDGLAVVADDSAGTDNDGALFIVNIRNGERILVTDFGDPAQGPIGNDPVGVALSQDFSNAYVVDESGESGSGLLFHVNLRTGERIIISDFDDPSQGPTGELPSGIALDGDETAYIVDGAAGTDSNGALFHVDLATGDREIVSDFGDPVQGPIGQTPVNLTLDGAGGAYVTDKDGPGSINGILFLVDLTSGDREIISIFNDPAQGPTGPNPFGIALDGLGNAFVADEDAGGDPGDGALFLVNLSTGNRTLLSNFTNSAQGPLGGEPEGVATDGFGQPLVADKNAGSGNDGGLFLVDMTTGDRILVSDFGNPTQGPTGGDPTGVAFKPIERNVPTLSQWGLISAAALLGIIGFITVRRRKIRV